MAGLRIQVTTLGEAVNSILAKSLESLDDGCPVRFINAYSLALSVRHDEYRSILAGPGVNFPDGAPVAWLMRHTGAGNAAQVRGPSFFEAALASGVTLGVRHYLFGTNPSTLAQLQKKIEHDHPGVNLVGLSAPDYGSISEILNEENIQRIKDSSPDIVWVALGTPKQDFVTSRLAEATGLTCIGVGAAFDFAAGTQREAPHAIRAAGMEWLFRLISNPRRLGGRYLWGNSVFLGLALRTLLGAGRAEKEVT